MRQIKLVVSDLDGTLLGEDRQIPDEAVLAVKRIQDMGIFFSFISGRPMNAMDQFAKQVPVNAPLVSCNGALIYDKGQILKCCSMKLFGLRRLMEKAASLGMTVLYYTNGQECAMTKTEWVRIREGLGRVYPVRPLTSDQWRTMAAEKVNIMNDNGEAVFSLLKPEIEKLKENYEMVCYGNSGCEIVAKNVNKAAALRQLAGLMHLSMEEILAVGDNENDNEMLLQAGIGAAVANAQESTKRCADYVCFSQRSLGVVEAIEKFCL